LLEDVALAVAHHHDPARFTQPLFGGGGAFEPAEGLLGLDRARAPTGDLGVPAAPDLQVGEAEAFSGLGIERQHGMHEQPEITAVADRPELLLGNYPRLISA
jgi:hypothetical protein